MNTQTAKNYTFDKVAKTVTITGYIGNIEAIKQITDITTTTPTIIFDPTVVGLGGTLAGNVLTLNFNTNTGSFNNTDRLEIIFDNVDYIQPVNISSISYYTSTSNNSTTNINAGGNFTGAVESVFNFPAVQVLVVCDQNYTVNVLQYIDLAGTKLIDTVTFTRLANSPLCENVIAVGNFFRVVVTNNGGSATTLFELNTTFGPLDSQPKALTNNGNFRTAIMEALPAGTNTLGGVNIIGGDSNASGNITTQNLVPAGVATAGSAVEIIANSQPSTTIQVTGTYTGALSIQATVDGNNWITMTGSNSLLNINTGVFSSTIASATIGIFQIDSSGFARIRITALAAVTGTASITIKSSQNPTTILNKSLPVGTNTIGAVTTPALVTQSAGVGFAMQTWNTIDVASAAITTTTTTATITPTNTQSCEFNVIVSAVSGTTPTLDVTIEESDDAGGNWYPVYAFQRITAVGQYRSPLIQLTGSRLRYAQTITGTTPSFTRAVNRNNFSVKGLNLKNFYDRTINLTTLNATTPTYFVDGADNFYVTLVTTGSTTGAVVTMEGSVDTTNWYSLTGTPLSTGTGNTNVIQIYTGVYPKFIRGRVSTAGVSTVLNYLEIKAIGR